MEQQNKEKRETVNLLRLDTGICKAALMDSIDAACVNLKKQMDEQIKEAQA